MCVDDVADGISREITIVGFTGEGIVMERGCGAVGRAEDIGTYHKVVGRIKKLPLLHGVGPPVTHVTVASQSMTHPYDIGVVLVKRSVSMVSYM